MALLYDDFGSKDSKDLGLDTSAIEIFLDPGEYFVGDASYQVRTLLGSCVSMILWHPRLRYGAMSHFLLASRSGGGSAEGAAPDVQGKYADEVLDLMIRELGLAGVPVAQCQAKVFGGGNMFPDHKLDPVMNIGLKNGKAAKRLLEEHGLTVVAEDLYGAGHREIIFNLGNGDVWVRRVKIDAMAA